MPGGRPKSDVKQRFLAKVKKMESGCHEWQAGLHRDGYGKFQDSGKTLQTHRVAYGLFVGDIPKGRWVLHECDNRKCVNPKHLFLGDAVANIADMDAKKRRGTFSNITAEQADEMCSMLAFRIPQREVAKVFGVHQTTVSRIKLGKRSLFKK